MSIKRATLLDKRRATKLQKSRTRKFKTERKRLKEMKLAKNSGLEIREGKTYESEIGMTEQNVDEIEIPDPPEIRELTDNILTAPILIFDLETTGLQRTSDIIQIAAYSQNNKFSSYIMPNRVISNGASAVTNISVIGSQMYYNLQAVPSKLQNVAFTDFNDFVMSFPVKPLLVGHNIKRYDCHVMYNSLKFHNMWNEFASNISGFLDTLELFKLLYPKRPSYSQTSLVGELLGETYSAHNAVDDTKALYRLVQSKGDIKCNIQALVFSANYPKEFSHQQDNLQTFTDAFFSKAISRTLALKAARSNLRLEHFNIAVKRNGLDGLKSVLSEQTNQGIVRVTTNKKAIIKIFDFLTRES
ncbi:maternal protein exuperantia-like [Mytilus edulis]|uniref:maternal protein exuperantia-like n=1 Tax=Mytilus edulis TaxID=6550 RepID=UPI0039F05F69